MATQITFPLPRPPLAPTGDRRAAGIPDGNSRELAWQREMERAQSQAWLQHPFEETHAGSQQPAAVGKNRSATHKAATATSSHHQPIPDDRQTPVLPLRDATPSKSGLSQATSPLSAFANSTRPALPPSPPFPGSTAPNAIPEPIDISARSPRHHAPGVLSMDSVSLPVHGGSTAFDTTSDQPHLRIHGAESDLRLPMRLHVDRHPDGVRLWVGVDIGTGDAAYLVPQVVDQLLVHMRDEGTPVLSIVCNGRHVYGTPTAALNKKEMG